MNLYNEDCFNIFPKIEDKSIDLFVLDLPYANKKFGNCTACAWDTPIDLEKMWKEIKRIMKPNATIIHFCNTKFGFALIESNPKWFRYDLIWKKSRKVGFLSANKMPLRQHENIYIFKDNQGTYNPQKTEGKPYKHGADNNPNNVYGITKEKGTIIKTDRHPTSIIDNTILKYNNPHKTIHRTEKPVGLLEYLIKTYSNEGDLIMDFTMGSGSCGVACYNTKRKFIGVEMDKDIYQLTKNRIEEHLKK
jgi:site-specific DNA-methyltransferase (adenine-specific)